MSAGTQAIAERSLHGAPAEQMQRGAPPHDGHKVALGVQQAVPNTQVKLTRGSTITERFCRMRPLISEEDGSGPFTPECPDDDRKFTSDEVSRSGTLAVWR